MFNSLFGTVTAKMPQSLFLETGGIEWDITVSDSSLDAFAPLGSTTRVFIWLYHREDAMKLFGFASPEERSVFTDLLKVDGIGPKAAIKILSSISAQSLAAALDCEDIAALEKISGIGKKTAQKMILTLKGKLAASDDIRIVRKPPAQWQEVITALADMGYDIVKAEETVLRIVPTLEAHLTPQEKESVLFRQAIIALAGN